MNTLKLTAEHFKDGVYIGKEDVSNYDGHIEIAANLGAVTFNGSINCTGSLMALAGSGIEAGSGIKAGAGIEAGYGITAGWSIEAGEGIKAGWGIKAGLSVRCGKVLSFRLNLFAGTAIWKDAQGDDKKVICGKLEGGVVRYGDVVETGLPDEAKDAVTPSEDTLTLNGKTYKLIPA